MRGLPLLVAAVACVALVPLPAAAQGAAHVHIASFAFDSGELRIAPGAEVVWDNHDSAPHTVTSDDGRFSSSANLGKGATHRATFPSAGTFPYHCAIHPSMRGKVVVEAPASGGAPAPTVRIVSPVSGANVAGGIPIRWEVTPATSTVTMIIEGGPTLGPFPPGTTSAEFNSSAVPDGPRKITVRAANGEQAAEAAITLNVRNTPFYQVRNLRVEPVPLVEREAGNVHVNVWNMGGRPGTVTVKLRVADALHGEETVSIVPGPEGKDVRLTVVAAKAGPTRIEVVAGTSEPATTVVTVAPARTADAADDSKVVVSAAPAAAALVALLGLAFAVRRR